MLMAPRLEPPMAMPEAARTLITASPRTETSELPKSPAMVRALTFLAESVPPEKLPDMNDPRSPPMRIAPVPSMWPTVIDPTEPSIVMSESPKRLAPMNRAPSEAPLLVAMSKSVRVKESEEIERAESMVVLSRTTFLAAASKKASPGPLKEMTPLSPPMLKASEPKMGVPKGPLAMIAGSSLGVVRPPLSMRVSAMTLPEMVSAEALTIATPASSVMSPMKELPMAVRSSAVK
jgi:hypothetical protein